MISLDEIRAAAAAIANCRRARAGIPNMANVLDMIPAEIQAAMLEDARVALEAAEVINRIRDCDALSAALVAAVTVARSFHGLQMLEPDERAMWAIYYERAPEMEPIRKVFGPKGVEIGADQE